MATSGSEIAKNGFKNEQEVADKFNNWQNDLDAQRWLKIMMYDINEIQSVHAEKIGMRGYKSDINIVINITIVKNKKNTTLTSVENIQVKLVSNSKGFNQVEKRKVDKYENMWHIPSDISTLLKLYDGELSPRENSRDSRRMFVNEFTDEEQKKLINFFQKNMIMIISDVIRGRGRFAAEWTLVINKMHDTYNWILISINEAINLYAGNYKASITPSGNIHLGNITLQRKGGDNGANSANMLQFKADPMILFTPDTYKYTSAYEGDY